MIITDTNDFAYPFLFQKLTDEFRDTYCNMWMSVLNGDEGEIINSARKMGIDISNHHAQLLSCMISAKPWSAVKRGLANTPDEKTRLKEVGCCCSFSSCCSLAIFDSILSKFSNLTFLYRKMNFAEMHPDTLTTSPKYWPP